MSSAGPSRPRGVLGHPAVWVAIVALAFAVPFALSTRPPAAPPLPVLSTLPAFSLLDQENKPFDRARLAGHATIANFIFTTCPTICPVLTTKMAGLEARTRGTDVRLVSFSVDPDTDTPAVLKSYGAVHHADFARWSFLTGPREEIERAVVDGFKVALTREKRDAGGAPGPDIWDIVHGEHFVLLDAEARIRGYYRADEEGMARLVDDARALAAAPPAEALAGVRQEVR